MMLRSSFLLAMTAALAAAPALAVSNVIPSAATGVTVIGTHGVLRGLAWSTGNTPSNPQAPISGTFLPTSNQWNNGTFWWDADPSVATVPVQWILSLDSSYTFERFQLQADNNDSYRIDYWDGTDWATAANIGTLGGGFLTIRDTGAIAPITTNKFRIMGVSGDNYFSIAQFAGFGSAVPEPGTWAMLIAGFGLVGAAARRRAARLAA